jgi:hypothetical protein
MKDIYGRTKGNPCEVCGGTEYPHGHSAPMTPHTQWEENFNRKFLTPEGFWNRENDMYPFKVKNFIKDLLTSHHTKMRELNSYEEGYHAGLDSKYGEKMHSRIIKATRILTINEIRKKLEGMRNNSFEYHSESFATHYQNGYNQAIEDALKALNEEGV